MAKSRTMIKADICTSDGFLDMSHSAQALYFQLNLAADAQGVVTNSKRILRISGFDDDHLSELERSGYVIFLDAARLRLVVIAHWWEMNTKDSHNWAASSYQSELKTHLCTIENGRTYVLKSKLGANYALTEQTGEVTGIYQAKLIPVCDQSENRLEPVFNLNKRKERKEPPAQVSACPRCSGSASSSLNADGSTLFDCPSCGLFQVPENGELFQLDRMEIL